MAKQKGWLTETAATKSEGSFGATVGILSLAIPLLFISEGWETVLVLYVVIFIFACLFMGGRTIRSQENKFCPECKQMNAIDATSCRHCHWRESPPNVRRKEFERCS